MTYLAVSACALGLLALIVSCSGGEGKATATVTMPPGTVHTTSGASPAAKVASPVALPSPKTPSQSAGDAAKDEITRAANGQAGPEWDNLVTEQQALVSRDAFIQCRNTGGIQVTGMKVLTTYQETVQIPGTTTSVPTTAVTIQLSYKQAGQAQQENITTHEVNEGGTWRWILAQDAITAATSGTGSC